MEEGRALRLENKIQRDIGEILLRNIDFPAGAVVTVGGVALKRSREYVDIYVAVFPPEYKGEVMNALKEKRGFIQHKLTRKLGIYPMPQIRLFYDEGAENAARIERQFMENPPEIANEEDEG